MLSLTGASCDGSGDESILSPRSKRRPCCFRWFWRRINFVPRSKRRPCCFRWFWRRINFVPPP
ncbi:hypothetical protein THER5_2015 [Bifidobacterium thermacidophilum subsp. thermacidophilum]|uniref:Uncharacterized protein n=1 Tax=Bifidobacterium thermacidophilum subsp. thermacidophilum TaxID=79262 RepID=A0A087E4I0_9BIFI|nr:hypothetical protein THER5_2015 [Bifidobacterium thermacidophilum subsp. thermacidophilum]